MTKIKSFICILAVTAGLLSACVHTPDGTSDDGNSSNDFEAAIADYCIQEEYNEQDEHYLVDWNQDGYYELIVKTDESEAQRMFYFYKLSGSTYRKTGEISGNHSILAYGDTYGLFRIREHMGAENMYKVTEDGQDISEQLIYTNCPDPEEEYEFPEEILHSLEQLKESSLEEVIEK